MINDQIKINQKTQSIRQKELHINKWFGHSRLCYVWHCRVQVELTHEQSGVEVGGDLRLVEPGVSDACDMAISLISHFSFMILT